MDVKHLIAVLAVARHGSFTKAAHELFMSQPTVSRHVAAVEREVGWLLFHRRARSVRLTAAGEAFLPHAHAVVTALNAGLEAVRSAETPNRTEQRDSSSRRSA